MKAQYGALISGDLKENTLIIEMDEAITLRAGDYAVIRLESISDKEKLEEFLKEQNS